MNITFLIGNGFDVGVGMKSKFKDFFPIYKEKSKSKEKRIKQLSDEIEGNYETWADFEKALGEYTAKFTPETKQDFIDQIKDFQSEFIAYLQSESELIECDSESIGKQMAFSLDHFYLDGCLAWESETLIDGVFANHSNEDHRYNFINFNYTDVLERCLETIPSGIVRKRTPENKERNDRIGKMVHVHGKMGFHSIVGVNDVEQIANKEIAKDSQFSKFIIKPLINKALRNGNDADAIDMIRTSDIICIYGMSLGETDKKWWKLLMEWLSGNSRRQLVVYDYDSQYNDVTPYEWMEKEDNIINKFKKYCSDTNINVENLRPRIHISINMNLFERNLRTEKNWINEKIPAIV